MRRFYLPCASAILALGVLLCAGSVAVLSWLIHHDQPRSVQGRYPSPKTRYQGMTAAQWNSLLLDADYGISWDGAMALHHLGSEGVPYLLNAINRFADRKQIAHLHAALSGLNGALLEEKDLKIPAAILSSELAGQMWNGVYIRDDCLLILRQAGSKGEKLIPRDLPQSPPPKQQPPVIPTRPVPPK